MPTPCALSYSRQGDTFEKPKPLVLLRGRPETNFGRLKSRFPSSKRWPPAQFRPCQSHKSRRDSYGFLQKLRGTREAGTSQVRRPWPLLEAATSRRRRHLLTTIKSLSEVGRGGGHMSALLRVNCYKASDEEGRGSFFGQTREFVSIKIRRRLISLFLGKRQIRG